jgi:hypothetical protein
VETVRRYGGRYASAVWDHWATLVTGIVLAAVGLIAAAVSVTVPAWVFWALGLVFVVVAQFRAWVDVRRELDAVNEQLEAQRTMYKRADFTDERLHLTDLINPADPFGAVQGKTFIRCRIVGPAVMVAGQNEWVRVSFIGDMPGFGFEPLPDDGATIKVSIGKVPVQGCQFIDCTFERIGITAPQEVIDQFHASLTMTNDPSAGQP